MKKNAFFVRKRSLCESDGHQMGKESAPEKAHGKNGPFYRREKASFLGIPPCPRCRYRAKYTDFLPVGWKKRKKCDKCGSELCYSVSEKTVILGFLMFLAAFGGSLLSMYLFENVWYMFLVTFLIIFGISFLIPLTMQVDRKK